ncbi:NAD(P)-dependent oxidoreductase [Actinophytocola xinjiangensis]|uniref:NAD(P)-dependent oxidoreductase n=1 Tax=Actinophytocola xinjiangensis TaxID=485602 RepID=A0A7Z1AZ77_9PSEU|nr:NAD(P)H-binding protein [Actinophytocola xinjiangensis]OLF12832.1 NAD(P)-dependent oxidoreductase [Actinophytocola xinjiangensis]
MNAQPILVTGATGKSGRRIVARLRLLGIPVRAASRTGEHPFDWTDPGTWDAALDGVRALYLVQLNGSRLVRPFLDSAARHGVRRVVLASGRGLDDPDHITDTDGIRAAALDSEAAVRDSGLDWTISRPGWFAQTFTEGVYAAAVRAGELRLPAGDGAASFVDADDVAAVAVAALTEQGHAGATYELSGPQAVTLTEVAATLTRATGRTVRYVPLSTREYIAELVEQGLPVTDAEAFATLAESLRRGKDAHLSDGVQRALGRPPRTFAEAIHGARPATT